MSKSANSSLSSLISLIFFYFILIALLVLFGAQVLNGTGEENGLFIAILWFAALIVPVVLLFSILSNILSLIRQRHRSAPGAGLKTRLMMYFLVIVLLSAIPQAVLSLTFLRVIGNTWFGDEIGQALQGSLDITASTQEYLADDLENFVYNALFENIAARAFENPERLYVQTQQIRPSVNALQVFDGEGNERFFGGDALARVEYSDVLRSPEGQVIRDIKGERRFIRVTRTFSQQDEGTPEEAVVVVMQELPRGFGEKTIAILSALELFTQYRDIKNLLYTGITVFYGVFSLPLVFLSILTAFYLSDVLIQPIANLENATRRISEGDFSFRILSRSKSEMGHLVDSFNSMITELERSRNQLMQSERVSAWKDIAQRLAHEIKNPLTPIKLSAQRMQRKYERNSEDFPQVLDASVRTIIREVDHLSGLLTEFRDFARLPFPKPRHVVLQKVISDVLEVHRQGDVSVTTDGIDEHTKIFVDPDQFRQVLGNLVKNAVESMEGPEGALHFTCAVLSSSGKSFHRIGVQDNGSGISEAEIADIFNPYFTTKEGGTGLGLAIVQRIIQDHNGEIRVESEPGVGTRFYIDIPVVEA